MSNAEHATSPLRHPDRLFIDGAWVAPSTDASIAVVNAATGALYARVAEANERDIDRAVSAARRAFDNGRWSGLSHCDRAAYLRAIADEVDSRADDIAAIWPNETGIVHSVA
ncbi:aldehyde dehydrogenase family protein, partial [Escherichia coli]|uniref:aldehyde dehydrogenase family protein n=1 Tax=Escherichia coli TaxID=562 RepID=UPI0019093DAF